MNRILAWVLVALSMSVPVPAVAQEHILVEWADHARDPKALIGDPVFVRSLYCRGEKGASACELTSVTIGHPLGGEGGRPACPLFVRASAFRTEAGDLRVQRTGDDLDVEVDDIFATIRFRLALMTSSAGPKIVRRASGVMVSKPAGDERVRATELVAFAKNSKGSEKQREFLEIEMNCSKVSVVVAKTAGK